MSAEIHRKKVLVLLTDTDYVLGVFSNRDHILPSLKTYFPDDEFKLIEESDTSIRFSLNDSERAVSYTIVEQEILTEITNLS